MERLHHHHHLVVYTSPTKQADNKLRHEHQESLDTRTHQQNIIPGFVVQVDKQSLIKAMNCLP
jgi:hypothetical protein